MCRSNQGSLAISFQVWNSVRLMHPSFAEAPRRARAAAGVVFIAYIVALDRGVALIGDSRQMNGN